MSFGSFLSGAISGGGALPGLAGLFGAKDAERATAKANAFSASEAEKNRVFQERMSSSAYQRSMEDMRRAGLNPMLAMGGSGASTPSGSMAQTFAADVAGAANRNVSTAIDRKRLQKELAATDSMIEMQKAQAVAARSAAALNANSAAKAAAETKNVEVQNAIMKNQLPKIAAEARLDKKRAEFDEGLVKVDGIGGRILQGIGGLFDAINIRRIFQGTTNDRNESIIRQERHLHRQGAKGSRLP